MSTLHTLLKLSVLFVFFYPGGAEDRQFKKGDFLSLPLYQPNRIYTYARGTESKVRWKLITMNGETTDLGSCQNQTCNSSFHPAVKVERLPRDPLFNVLEFTNHTHDKAGTLIFEEDFNGTVTIDNCTVDVIYVAEVGSCSTEIIHWNWTAVTSCNISKVYSALGRQRCQLIMLWENWRSDSSFSQNKYLPKTEHPDLKFDVEANETQYMASYNITSLGPYNKGRCDLSWHIPKFDCLLTVSVKVFPGDIWKFLNSFPIERPTRPTHNCKNLKYIPEKGQVPCVCIISSQGKPEGRLIWFSGDTIIAASNYSVTQLQFPSDQVDRRHDGLLKRCQRDWVEKENLYVTERVAYGPDRVQIQYWQKITDSNSTFTIVVTCDVYGVNPMTSDMIHWDGACQGQTGFTCMVTLTPESNGTEVTCTVVNAENNGHSAQASARVIFTELTKQGSSVPRKVIQSTNDRADDDDGMALGVAIGAGAVFGVAAAVAAVVVTIMCRKGRLRTCLACFNPVYDKPSAQRRRQEDKARTYTDLAFTTDQSQNTSSTTEFLGSQTGATYTNLNQDGGMNKRY